MNKLRTQAVLAICLFLALVLGSFSLFYFLFASDYYILKKKNLMNTAFSKIQTLDLKSSIASDDPALNSLETESFSIIICDKDFHLLYTSKIWNPNSTIHEVMIPEKEIFSETAQAAYITDRRQRVALHGLVHQNGDLYYIYIYENTNSVRRSIQYMNHFLIEILLVTLVLGSLFAWFLCTLILKPLQNVSKVAERITENDFSVRASESISTYELNQLAKTINLMADKIQRDINDLNNYNYLLLRQNRNMAEFEDIRKKFVSKVTHELKTPLAIISSQVEMLQYEYDDSQKDYYFSSIMEEIEKMSSLISNILHHSFTDRAMTNTLMAKDSLSTLLETLVPKYKSWMTTSNIEFTALLQENCFAVFDALQIEQAINNYMMNACKYTLPNDRIILTLRQEEDSIYCSVYNDGIPIPKEEQTHIWESFYQSHADSSDSGSTEIGLGLYIVKDIIRLHHGTCGVFNCRRGVEFWFRLPKAERKNG